MEEFFPGEMGELMAALTSYANKTRDAADDREELRGEVQEIQEEEQIGRRGELFVDAPNLQGVKAADALVGHGGEVVAVQDDDLKPLVLMLTKCVFPEVLIDAPLGKSNVTSNWAMVSPGGR